MRLMMIILGLMFSISTFAQNVNQNLLDQNKANLDFIQSIKQKHEKDQADCYKKTQKDLNKLAMKIATDQLNNG